MCGRRRRGRCCGSSLRGSGKEHSASVRVSQALHEPENIGPDELLTLREIGASWLSANALRVALAITEGRCEMAKTKVRPSRLTRALLETADDMRRVGIMGAIGHEKITLRHLGADAPALDPLAGEEIRALR